MDWIQSHWVGLLAIIGAAEVILGVVSAWTPWKWDDNLYVIIHNLVAKFFPQK